jgi:hypothetical protein
VLEVECGVCVAAEISTYDLCGNAPARRSWGKRIAL